MDSWDAHLGMEEAAFRSLALTSVQQVLKRAYGYS